MARDSGKLPAACRGWEARVSARIGVAINAGGSVACHPCSAKIRHFLDCIEQGKDGNPSLLNAIQTARVCLAVDASAARGGEAVKVRV